uniref:Uncharacterized protein n=1 Tax=Anguilla anguilla TaxID=7936 RepID=A0A0E9SY86_ANGAN
MYKRSNILKN